MGQTRLGGFRSVLKKEGVPQWRAKLKQLGTYPNCTIGAGDKEERWHGCHRRDALH